MTSRDDERTSGNGRETFQRKTDPVAVGQCLDTGNQLRGRPGDDTDAFIRILGRLAEGIQTPEAADVLLRVNRTRRRRIGPGESLPGRFYGPAQAPGCDLIHGTRR